MGQPGTLPVLNQEVVKYAIRAGLAINGKISQVVWKNFQSCQLVPACFLVSLIRCYNGTMLLFEAGVHFTFLTSEDVLSFNYVEIAVNTSCSYTRFVPILQFG